MYGQLKEERSNNFSKRKLGSALSDNLAGSKENVNQLIKEATPFSLDQVNRCVFFKAIFISFPQSAAAYGLTAVIDCQ